MIEVAVPVLVAVLGGMIGFILGAAKWRVAEPGQISDGTRPHVPVLETRPRPGSSDPMTLDEIRQILERIRAADPSGELLVQYVKALADDRDEQRLRANAVGSEPRSDSGGAK